ncbi:MAG: transcriptional regulator [Sulfolobaceae archaeon]|nr:transcriptional regulator [Sulfolobaceae archaeon]
MGSKRRKKRSKLIIVFDLLKNIEGGMNKTNLMYRTNLSYALLEKYLKALMDKGLVIQDGKVYKLTEKGHLILRKLEELFSLHKEIAEIREYIKDQIGDIEA